MFSTDNGLNHYLSARFVDNACRDVCSIDSASDQLGISCFRNLTLLSMSGELSRLRGLLSGGSGKTDGLQASTPIPATCQKRFASVMLLSFFSIEPDGILQICVEYSGSQTVQTTQLTSSAQHIHRPGRLAGWRFYRNFDALQDFQKRYEDELKTHPFYSAKNMHSVII